MSAQPIPDGNAEAMRAPTYAPTDLLSALRALYATAYPEALPHLAPEVLDILRDGSPWLTDPQRMTALGALALLPGTAHALRVMGYDPQQTLRVLGGALTVTAPLPHALGKAAESRPRRDAPAEENALRAALAWLGLPEENGDPPQYLATLSAVLRLPAERVSAAVRLIPHFPALEGALHIGGPVQMLTHFAVAGAVLGVHLAAETAPLSRGPEK